MESSADERKLRAFIALKTPSEWDERLGELQHDLKPKLGGSAFRWVKPAQIHITLRFFGWLTTNQVGELNRILPKIMTAHPPFRLICAGLGCFPNARRPRVFWAGLEGELSHAGALQSSIVKATSHLGEPPEDRPFKPHLTLARLKEPDPSVINNLEHAMKRGFKIDQAWCVDKVLLMQSHLLPQGSEYETLASYCLS